MHLNDQGNWLIADVLARHLVENQQLPVPGTGRDYVPGKDVPYCDIELSIHRLKAVGYVPTQSRGCG